MTSVDPTRSASAPSAVDPPSADPEASRVVVAGAGGGEGATTVTALVAALLADEHGWTRRVIGRPDDPIAARLPAGLDVAEHGLLIDAGPHAADDTLRATDVRVIVCAATTGAIQRGRSRVAEADARGLTTAALVVCARAASEGRRGRVRMQQAALADPRIVPLPFDPALAAQTPLDVAALAATSVAAGRAVLRLLSESV